MILSPPLERLTAAAVGCETGRRGNNFELIGVELYSGTSLIRSPMGLGKTDLNGELTVLQGAKLHCGTQYMGLSQQG